MTRTLNLLTFESPDPEHQNTFDVLIAYEDLETGKRAKKAYDFLVENLGGDCRFTNRMWKFEVLGIPNLREMAINDCAEADLIVISCHGANLPAEVQAWIELWLREPHRPFALVAIFDQEGDSADTRHYLAGVCKRGKMEFLAHPDTGREATVFESQPRIPIQDFASFMTSQERETSVPRWGINE